MLPLKLNPWETDEPLCGGSKHGEKYEALSGADTGIIMARGGPF